MVKVPWWTFTIALVLGFVLCWVIVVVPAGSRAAADLAGYNSDRAVTDSQLALARSNLDSALASLGTVKGQLDIANRATAAATANAGKLRDLLAERDANDKRLAEQLAAGLTGAKSSLDIYNVCDYFLHGLFLSYHPSPGKQGPGG